MSLVAKLLPVSNVLLDLSVSSKKRLFEQVGSPSRTPWLARSLVFDSFSLASAWVDRTRTGRRHPHGRIKGLKDALGAGAPAAARAFDAPTASP